MRRVVITGMGAVTPIGNTLDDYWNGLKAGTSGVRTITRFDASGMKSSIAAEVKNFDPEPVIDAKEVRRIDYFSQYGIVAANEAIEHSGFSMENDDPYRCGVIFGSGIGGINVLEKNIEVYLNKGPNRVSPFYITGMISDIVAGHIAMRFGFRGPNFVTTSACASGAHAIGTAYKTIAYDDADVIITGGAEGSITPTSVAGFVNIQALSRRNDEPEKASRPFNADRDGFVMGEGSGALILEELEHALNRGATIYGEITGVGFTADAHHITAPDPEGASAAHAMKLAIDASGITTDDIDYINCHCPSTPAGDIGETRAIKSAFGRRAYDLNISSTKSMTGHLLGAAGAVELIATVQAVQHGLIPPTINYENPDPECDLNCTPNTPVERTVTHALSNSFGFGGHNATIVVKKYMD